MANQISAIKEIENAIDQLNRKLLESDSVILKISKDAREVSKNFYDVKLPNDVNAKLQKSAQFTEQLNAQLKEQDRLERALITQIERKALATESTNRALIKERFETAETNKLIKESVILSSRYASELRKAEVIRNKSARTIQDLNVKRDLGNKLTKEEIRLLKQSEAEFKRYDKVVRNAKEGVGRFQESVGNYEKGFNSILSITRQLVGAFGVIEGLRLAWDFTQESAALAREAKGVEFAFERLGIAGVDAFERVKRSTRGLLSDLDIKRALVDFDNFNISLEETDTLFEFLAVRSAQTGKSIDSLRDSLVEGLSKESKLRIDNLGISAAELNAELEKTPDFVQAVANIAKREIAEAGDILDEAANSQEKFNAAFENFKVSAGTGFLGTLVNDLYNVKTQLIETATAINDASDGYGDFFTNIARVVQGQGWMVASQAAVNNARKQQIALIDTIIKNYKDLGYTEQELIKYKQELLKLSQDELKSIAKNTEQTTNQNAALERNVQYLDEQITKLKEKLQLQTNREGAEAIQEQIKALEKERDAILGVEKAQAKANAVLNGSVAFMEANIKKLEDQQNRLATTAPEWREYGKQIEAAKNELAKFKAEVSNVAIETPDLDGEALSTPTKIEGFDYEKAENEVLDFLNTFENAKKREAEIEKETQQKKKEFLEEFYGGSLQIVNNLFDAKVQRYEDDINRNSDYYAELLANETLSEEQRDALEAQRDAKEAELEKKQREVQRKQAIFNKTLALTEIAIDTAQKVAAIKAQAALLLANPFTAPYAAVSLAQIPYVLGSAALAAGAIASEPIPAYEKGKGDSDNYEGLAIWGEKRQEVKVSKDGTLELSPRQPGNHLTHVKKDDIIHPDANKFFKNLSDEELYNNVHKYAILANISDNNLDALMLQNSLEKSIQKQTNTLVKAYGKQKTRINLHNNNSVGKDLAFMLKKQNTL